MTEVVAGPAFKEQVRETLADRHKATLDDQELVRAGVLLLLFEKGGEWHILFTRRTLEVESHKGQVSFPGGACEQWDGSVLAAALRETEEEVGVRPEDVEVLGDLDDALTLVTRYVISPFVAVIPYPYPFQLNRGEVHELVEVPISSLLDRGNFWEEVELRDFGPYPLYYWDYRGTIIWGATGRILKQFLDVIFGPAWGQKREGRSEMALEFHREYKQTRLLDPKDQFKETTRIFEVRTDPLTGHQCRVASFPFPRPAKQDLSPLVERSLELGCPFCHPALEQAAPRFPPDLIPEGLIRRGQCTVVPSIMPYQTYGAVAPFSREHHIPLDRFEPDLLTNAFLTCQEYLRRVLAHDPTARYQAITWSYMPPAGDSVIHPHLQVEADDSPPQYQRQLLERCRVYSARNLSNYWEDLAAAERESGERYIGATGDILWLAPFVPRAILPDAMALFQGKDSIVGLSEEDLAHFAQGLCRVLKYISDSNWYSFNMAIYSGLPGEDHLWTQARVVVRAHLPPFDSSDHIHLARLQDEYCLVKPPEDVAAELRAYFRA